ncbi:multiple epidermal growth factor-like domains protein 10 isoform X3 [Crassostrea angulata]|uniref:multiple epidermal growth factor-like domains protein 10 isoform X3 n=1 Tax=Magallana angulata TaxID=2784310 RepID=UPI0022B0D3F4|nr:multiple epidermal growth factor-like domains protein 10 isoform X3 [Crassostrea angulata]
MYSLCLCFGLFVFSSAYVNIALNKSASQTNPKIGELYDASNAVDGRKTNLTLKGGQCASSKEKMETATWWVNLSSISSIHHITIYYRTNNKPWPSSRHKLPSSFLGFSLYVSNTTEISEGRLCFKDNHYTVTTIPPVFTVVCPMHGQYVIYYNERLKGVTYSSGYNSEALIKLCEVEVYGCPATGYYGFNCSIPCPDVNCQYCHIRTGTCQGCKPGYRGHRCEMSCGKGLYGDGCLEACGQCRNLTQCLKSNGSCLTGCNAGYQGAICKTHCDKGSYGVNCNSTCGHCRDLNHCFHVDGICLTGCDAGYIGELCEKTCDSGSYGVDCNETCGHCRDLNQCFYINGSCLTGCDNGFQGDKCIHPCEGGLYGVNCNETCGHCKNITQCFNGNGSCLTGCKPGYQEELCKSPCDRGLYGNDCNETCGHCIDIDECFHINGTCLTGCAAGYLGDLCNKLSTITTGVDSWLVLFYGLLFVLAFFGLVIIVGIYALRMISTRKLLLNDQHCNELDERSSNVVATRASGAFFYYYRENDEPVCTYVSRTNPAYEDSL